MTKGEERSEPNFFGLNFLLLKKFLNSPKHVFYIVVNLFLIYVVVPITTSPSVTQPAENSRFFEKVPQGVFIGPKIILHYI